MKYKCEKHKSNEGFDNGTGWVCWECLNANLFLNPRGRIIDYIVKGQYLIRVVDGTKYGEGLRLEIFDQPVGNRLVVLRHYRDLSLAINRMCEITTGNIEAIIGEEGEEAIRRYSPQPSPSSFRVSIPYRTEEVEELPELPDLTRQSDELESLKFYLSLVYEPMSLITLQSIFNRLNSEQKRQYLMFLAKSGYVSNDVETQLIIGDGLTVLSSDISDTMIYNVYLSSNNITDSVIIGCHTDNCHIDRSLIISSSLSQTTTISNSFIISLGDGHEEITSYGNNIVIWIVVSDRIIEIINERYGGCHVRGFNSR